MVAKVQNLFGNKQIQQKKRMKMLVYWKNVRNFAARINGFYIFINDYTHE